MFPEVEGGGVLLGGRVVHGGGSWMGGRVYMVGDVVWEGKLYMVGGLGWEGELYIVGVLVGSESCTWWGEVLVGTESCTWWGSWLGGRVVHGGGSVSWEGKLHMTSFISRQSPYCGRYFVLILTIIILTCIQINIHF